MLARWALSNKQPFKKDETDLGFVNKDNAQFQEMKLNGVDDDESDIFYVLKQNTNKRLLKINNCAADASYVYMSVCCFCR